MAKIRIPDRQVGLQEQRLRPVDDGMQLLGSKIQQAGARIQSAQAEYDAKARKIDIDNQVSSRVLNYKKEYDAWYNERSKNAGGFKDLHKDHEKKVEELRKKYGAVEDDNEINRLLKKNLDHEDLNNGFKINSLKRRQEMVSQKDAVLNNLDNMRTMAVDLPAKEYADYMQKTKDYLQRQADNGLFTHDAAATTLKKFQSQVQDGRILRMIQKDPSSALDFLKENTKIPGIDPGRHLQLESMARSRSAQGSAARNAMVTDQLQSNLITIEKTGQGIENIDKLAAEYYGRKPGALELYNKKVKLAQQRYQDKITIENGDPLEIKKLFSDTEVKPKDKESKSKTLRRQFIAQYMAETQKIRKADPAAAAEKYMSAVETPDQKLARQNMEAEINKQNLDPNTQWFDKVPQDLEDLEHREKLKNIQKSWGLEPNEVSLLTKNRASSIVEQYNRTKDSEKALLFQQLQDKYGSDYTIIFRDLVKHGSLPIEANLFSAYASTAQGPLLGPKLAAALKLKPEEFNKINKEISKSEQKVIRASIEAGMEKYLSTVQDADPNNLNTIPLTKFKESFYRMAALDYLKNKNAGAGETIAKGTFNFESGGLYTYLDNFIEGEGPGTYVVKANVRIPSGQQINTAALKNSMAVLTNWKFYKNNVILTSDRADIKGAFNESVKQDYYESVINTGKWVTKPDDSGIVFLDQRGDFVQYKDKSGKIKNVEIDFKTVDSATEEFTEIFNSIQTTRKAFVF